MTAARLAVSRFTASCLTGQRDNVDLVTDRILRDDQRGSVRTASTDRSAPRGALTLAGDKKLSRIRVGRYLRVAVT